VFVDEVHRFNKSQQDAFLPHVESGLFTFIGATTENPSFEVNSALLSRAAVYVLQPLGEADLAQIVARASAIGALPAMEQAAQKTGWSPMPTAMRGGCSTRWKHWPWPRRAKSWPK
jgi:putative ATPase